MIRVAIDASSASTGGGITYLNHMLPRLRQADGIRLGPMLVRADALDRLDGLQGIELVPCGKRTGAASRGWRRAVTRSGAGVVFAPTEITFATYDAPLVLAVRNPCMLTGNTREYGWLRNRRFGIQRGLARLSARRAEAHIAVSRYAARVGTDGLGIAPSRITTIYHGGPAGGRAEGTAAPRSGPVRRLLFVSNVYRYKNLVRLLEALSAVRGDWQLDVAGSFLESDVEARATSLVAERDLSSRVRFLGQTGGPQLDALYAGSDCLVWPSYAETFGHPLLEAHASELPIIAARAASNEEIAGEAAEYFDPFDVPALAASLQAALDNGLEPGPLPRRYDWDTCAVETAALLERVGRQQS